VKASSRPCPIAAALYHVLQNWSNQAFEPLAHLSLCFLISATATTTTPFKRTPTDPDNPFRSLFSVPLDTFDGYNTASVAESLVDASASPGDCKTFYTRSVQLQLQIQTLPLADPKSLNFDPPSHDALCGSDQSDQSDNGSQTSGTEPLHSSLHPFDLFNCLSTLSSTSTVTDHSNIFSFGFQTFASF
jgi:hypothetical protein